MRLVSSPKSISELKPFWYALEVPFIWLYRSLLLTLAFFFAIVRIMARPLRRRMTPKPLSMVIEDINIALRGWVGYFHYRNSSKAFNRLKFHVEARVHTHLRKRHKIKSRAAGFTRFTNRSLYEKYGLYTDNSGLVESACLAVKNIGKPCAGKPHARFDEGGLVNTTSSLLYPGILQHAAAGLRTS